MAEEKGGGAGVARAAGGGLAVVARLQGGAVEQQPRHLLLDGADAAEAVPARQDERAVLGLLRERERRPRRRQGGVSAWRRSARPSGQAEWATGCRQAGCIRKVVDSSACGLVFAASRRARARQCHGLCSRHLHGDNGLLAEHHFPFLEIPVSHRGGTPSSHASRMLHRKGLVPNRALTALRRGPSPCRRRFA